MIIGLYYGYIYMFFIFILLGFYYLMSNVPLKIKIMNFKIRIRRKNILLLVITGLIILPLIIIYSPEGNDKLVLSKDYGVVYSIEDSEIVLYGPQYTYTGYEGVGYVRDDYGVVDRLEKLGDVWLGYITDKNSNGDFYEKTGNDISSENFKRSLLEKLKETKGYFILEGNKMTFGLSEEELYRKVGKKIKIKRSPSYYIARYGEKSR